MLAKKVILIEKQMLLYLYAWGGHRCLMANMEMMYIIQWLIWYTPNDWLPGIHALIGSKRVRAIPFEILRGSRMKSNEESFFTSSCLQFCPLCICIVVILATQHVHYILITIGVSSVSQNEMDVPDSVHNSLEWWYQTCVHLFNNIVINTTYRKTPNKHPLQTPHAKLYLGQKWSGKEMVYL